MSAPLASMVGDWPWCDACQSWHSINNPTCKRFDGELRAGEEITKFWPIALTVFDHLRIVTDPAIPLGLVCVSGKNAQGDAILRMFKVTGYGTQLTEVPLGHPGLT